MGDGGRKPTSWGDAGMECRMGESRKHWDLNVAEGLSMTHGAVGPKPLGATHTQWHGSPPLHRRLHLLHWSQCTHSSCLLTHSDTRPPHSHGPAQPQNTQPSTTPPTPPTVHGRPHSLPFTQPDPVYKIGPKPTL